VRFEVFMVASMKMDVFWVVAPCSLVFIALMMEAASTSEMSVNFYQNIWRNSHTILKLGTKACRDGYELK
jgi:hypothetical protein